MFKNSPFVRSTSLIHKFIIIHLPLSIATVFPACITVVLKIKAKNYFSHELYHRYFGLNIFVSLCLTSSNLFMR